MARVKNAAFMLSRFGRPKEIFETPKTVFTPRVLRTYDRACNVLFAFSAPVLTVIASVSIMRSFLSIPYSFAVFIIFSAILILPSALSGIPLSSSVRQTTTPPYFLASGKIFSMLSFLPFTEFISGLPLYMRSACSIAAGSEVSI